MADTETSTSKTALAALIRRRDALQASYDAIMADPESFSVSGSVSATNRKLADLRAEIAAVERRIAMVARGAGGGIALVWPDYR